jgi:hypothetical protein
MTEKMKDKPPPAQDRKVSVVFIVNGVSVALDLPGNQPLQASRNRALELTQNTGRPKDEWDIKDETGRTLDPTQTPLEAGLQDSATIFLTLRAGAGGDFVR